METTETTSSPYMSLADSSALPQKASSEDSLISQTDHLKSNESISIAKLLPLLRDIVEKAEERIIHEIRSQNAPKLDSFGIIGTTACPNLRSHDSHMTTLGPTRKQSAIRRRDSRQSKHSVVSLGQEMSVKLSGHSSQYGFGTSRSNSSISGVAPVTLEMLLKANDDDVIRYHNCKKRGDGLSSCSPSTGSHAVCSSNVCSSNVGAFPAPMDPIYSGKGEESAEVPPTAWPVIAKRSLVPSFLSRLVPVREARVSAAEEVYGNVMVHQHTTDEGNLDGSINRENSLGKNLRGLREQRFNELLADAQDSARRRSRDLFTESCSPLWLCMCGILPWPSSAELDDQCVCYRYSLRITIMGLLIGSAAFCIHLLTQLNRDGAGQTCDSVFCTIDTILPTLILGLGCFFCLLSMFFVRDVVASRHDAILTNHLTSIDASSIWNMTARWDTLKLLLSWVCIVVLSIFSLFDCKLDDTEDVLLLAVHAFTTHIFLALVQNMLHICRGLYLGIDRFCAQLVEFTSCDSACEDWNMMQAILRRACITVARTYMLLLTSSLTAMCLPILYDNDWVAMLPGALAVLILLWVALYIGRVTSKCDCVPVFVNTLDFGLPFDCRRQYVVDYISNSRAGFYMFDVRITREMVVKCAYVGLAVVAAIFTRSVSRS